MIGNELILLTFNQFVYDKVILPLLENPVLLVGILIGLSVYFGFFWSFHTIKETPYLRKVFGMVIVVYNFGFFLLITYFLVNLLLNFLPLDLFRNIVVLRFFEFFIVVYTFISILLIANLSSRCDSSIAYAEVFPNSNVLIAEVIIKSLSLKHLISVSLSPLIVFFASSIILTYEESLPIGLFLLSIIFLNLSFYAIYLGITPDSYRYAEVFLKHPQRKSFKGRIKRIDDNSVDILIKKETGNYMIEIPINNISRIELRNLEEIQ
jgi:hypothetical protein